MIYIVNVVIKTSIVKHFREKLLKKSVNMPLLATPSPECPPKRASQVVASWSPPLPEYRMMDAMHTRKNNRIALESMTENCILK